MTHELKTHDGPFDRVKIGQKNFEFRKNDRNFQMGDTVILREYLPNLGIYTRQEIRATIGYVLKDAFGVPEGYCCFSLLDIKYVPENE
jgi:hypothetical protein